MRVIFTILICQFFYFTSQAQVYGCMDPSASNYDPSATLSNGSCIYTDVSVALKNMRKATLPDALHEISGIICFDGKLYGHNDSGGEPVLYEMDTTTGAITKTIILQGATNVDWEDIAQDETYVYVGDIGNNFGNRTDLKIYRLPKQAIRNISGVTGTIASSDIDVINYRYEDQTDFSNTAANQTRFDCEAMICENGNLHLFTKNWVGDYTVHYVLSATATPDPQVAIRKDSLNTGGVLITGAANVGYKTSVLLGYSVTIPPAGFLWLISGYNDMNNLFSSGNKRKIILGFVADPFSTGIGQVEGVTLATAGRVFISSEYFSKSGFIVPQSLYALDISPWIPAYLPLATAFTDISAVRKNGIIVIQWTFNGKPDHFEIETSDDGRTFRTAGTVKNEDQFHDHTFTDTSATFTNPLFYRIKVVLKMEKLHTARWYLSNH